MRKSGRLIEMVETGLGSNTVSEGYWKDWVMTFTQTQASHSMIVMLCVQVTITHSTSGDCGEDKRRPRLYYFINSFDNQDPQE